MFNLFRGGKTDGPGDVKAIRFELLKFIKQELQKAEGGEGGHIRGISMYMARNNAETPFYEAAVYADEPERFKEEVQRIADDYDVALNDPWVLEVVFDQEPPAGAVKAAGVGAAIFIRTNKNFIRQTATAYIRPLSGETDKAVYPITSGSDIINIGRDQLAQASDGFFRTNHIAFPSNSTTDGNKYVSRQHAHIRWVDEEGAFMIYADEGGIPPGNKLKIRPLNSVDIIKLSSTHIGHRLQEGDQIILGESAVLVFSYQPLHHE